MRYSQEEFENVIKEIQESSSDTISIPLTHEEAEHIYKLVTLDKKLNEICCRIDDFNAIEKVNIDEKILNKLNMLKK